MNNFIASDKNTLEEALWEEWKSYHGRGFVPARDVWTLRPSNDKRSGVYLEGLDFTEISQMPISLRFVLASIAERVSSGAVKSYVHALKRASASLTNGEIIDHSWFVAQKIRLGPREEYKLSQIRSLVKEWLELQIEIPSQHDANLIAQEKLKQAPQSEAVMMRGHQDGPLTRSESATLFKALNNALENGEVTLFQFVVTRLLYELGVRVEQAGHLRLSDFKFEWARAYVLMPRAKQGTQPRTLFSKRQISSGLGRAVQILIEQISSKTDNRDLSRIGLIDPENERHFVLKEGLLKLDKSSLRNILKQTVGQLQVPSEKTGEPINIFPRRLRYTLATEAIEDGEDPFVVAQMLDHETTQTISHYVQLRNATIDALDKKIGAQMMVLAAPFKGKIISRGTVMSGGPVFDPESDNEVGGCGTANSCGLPHPVACYSCPKFEPYKDAPHDIILDQMEKKKEAYESKYPAYARQLDQEILSIKRVIAACEQSFGEGNG